MIDLRETTVDAGTTEEILAEKLIEQNIEFRFGEIKAGNERQRNVFLTRGVAIRLSPFSEGVKESLRINKHKTQVWNQQEIKWQGQELDRQIRLHQ